LFHRGLVGTGKVELAGRAQVYGDVASDGTVNMKDQVRVYGSVTGSEVKGASLSRVTGLVLKQAAELTEFLPVTPPKGLIDLRKLEVQSGTRILQRGSYSASEIKVGSGATLRIDNTSGPVTIYVRRRVHRLSLPHDSRR
jgi:hypothetical protein